MKKIIFVLLFLPALAFAQQRADQLPEKGTAESTDTIIVIDDGSFKVMKLSTVNTLISSGGVSDGDKGDITVTTSGTVWTIDAGVVDTTEIATDGVGSAEIAADAVGPSELASTAVVAGSYTNTDITVDADGRITAASNGSSSGVSDGDKGDITVSSSGTVWNIDADAVGAAEIAADAVGPSELAATAVSAGSYSLVNVTVDADGRITSMSDATLSGTFSVTDASQNVTVTYGETLSSASYILYVPFLREVSGTIGLQEKAGSVTDRTTTGFTFRIAEALESGDELEGFYLVIKP